MTFLVIDAGNTRIKWAQFSHANRNARIITQGVEFLENLERLGNNAWPMLMAPICIYGCIVAGEGVRRRIEEQLEIWSIAPRWIIPDSASCGLTNGYSQPARLGPDRWVAMIGAKEFLRRRNLTSLPMVVVMVGTAVTIDAVDGAGNFLGGLIIPGHGIMLRALESGTAGLHVPTGEVSTFPTNTSDALTSGGTFAIAGAVAHMVRQLNHRTSLTSICIMSGGAGWKMLPHMSMPVELVENLIFDGLLAIAHDAFHNDPPATTTSYPDLLF